MEMQLWLKRTNLKRKRSSWPVSRLRHWLQIKGQKANLGLYTTFPICLKPVNFYVRNSLVKTFTLSWITSNRLKTNTRKKSAALSQLEASTWPKPSCQKALLPSLTTVKTMMIDLDITMTSNRHKKRPKRLPKEFIRQRMHQAEGLLI